MKNKLFGKAIPLVMGSLVLFSSQVFSIQALAISSNKNQELTNAKALGESELLIAQAPDSQALTPGEKNDLAAAVAAVSAESVFGPAIGAARAAAIPQTQKDAIAMAFSQAQSIFGPALSQATAVAQTKGDARAIARAFSAAESVLGPAFAQSKAVANSPGGDSLAQAAANAESVFGPAVAKATAVAR